MEKTKLTKWLNALIGSELNAFLQYEFASHVVEGTDWDVCNTEFKKHADEEREHMNKLLEAAVERDIEITTDLPNVIKIAKPSYEKMPGPNSDKMVQFHFNAEEDAIKTYREFYDLIKEDDVTLAHTIKGLLDDEVEHRKDLKKMFSSISGGEAEIKSRIKDSKFNY